MNQEYSEPEVTDIKDAVEGSVSEQEGDVPESDETRLSEQLENMQAENASLKERLLRATADMENLRKRTRREVNDARSYAIADFARDMLNAADNLSRALSSIPEELRLEGTPAVATLIEGIEMTEREMQRLMQKNGVRPISAEGEKFNPHKHQAMFEIPDSSVPTGTVLQVVQTGYEIGDRVLRPAMVGVSKGGPKANAETDKTGTSAGTEQTEEAGATAAGADEAGVRIDREV